MANERVVYGVSILAIIIGLVVLLGGEASHNDQLVVPGGVIALLGVGLMVLYISKLPSIDHS